LKDLHSPEHDAAYLSLSAPGYDREALHKSALEVSARTKDKEFRSQNWQRLLLCFRPIGSIWNVARLSSGFTTSKEHRILSLPE